ncbi:ATP-binding response regulator [Tahibacter amnicola]|uniref:histidine kinase n=1 Tax=Tahibacter amnicola TaxID=2976241 RepID=A0ABY6BH11_9GAMM|nr:ATP-binding protein [Tahibacter amnicola]UXI68360.1 ATP-binding protein [Tahibacter amnicola]
MSRPVMVEDGAAPPRRSAMALAEVAKQLRNEQISRLVAMVSERQMSVTRTVVFGLILAWVWYWKTRVGYQEVLVRDAVAVFPWALALFAASAGWMLVLRLFRLEPPEWADAIGIVASFAGIGILLDRAFILLISLNSFLPLIAVAVGVRYHRGAFWAATLASVFITWITAPPGYWISRPAYALYAFIFTFVLPLIVNRILSALREASIQAIVAGQAQSRFIATMSHELRTPLNSIVAGAALIDTRGLDGDQRRLLELVASNANALHHRVTEVLDVAAIDGNRLRLVPAPFFMADVVQTVSDICQPLADEKALALRFDVDRSLGDELLGDAGRIEQVLSNLVTNAVKFTPAGGTVDVAVWRENTASPGHQTVICTVTDTGPGIADADKKRVFDAFHQTSTGDTRRHGGVGLGLYIVKNVSDQMGGQLSVQDNPAGGTVFTWRFRLPLAPRREVPRRQTVLEALESHRRRIAPMRCLVVDDSAANREIFARILERAGHAATFAEDGPTALAAARAAPFDLVFLDLHMPGMSGWSVLAELQQLTADGPVPVVVISAHSHPAAQGLAVEQGAAAYLTKPIATQKLLETLEQVAQSRPAPGAVPGIRTDASSPCA